MSGEGEWGGGGDRILMDEEGWGWERILEDEIGGGGGVFLWGKGDSSVLRLGPFKIH